MAKKIHIYSQTPHSSYGGCAYINNLAFFDKNGTKFEISDIKVVNTKKVTFKINGINAWIDFSDSYGSSYTADKIFQTPTSYPYTVLVHNQTALSAEKRGFFINFESNVNGIAYVTLSNTYTLANDWVIGVDDKKYSEPKKVALNEVFTLELPSTGLMLVHKNEKWFYRKKVNA